MSVLNELREHLYSEYEMNVIFPGMEKSAAFTELTELYRNLCILDYDEIIKLQPRWYELFKILQFTINLQ